jgi:hypothetical protein
VNLGFTGFFVTSEGKSSNFLEDLKLFGEKSLKKSINPQGEPYSSTP